MSFFKLFFSLIFFVSNVFAKEVTVGLGFSLPPYIIKENNSGIELDIIKESLKTQGIILNYNYLPFKRILIELKAKRIDMAATMSKNVEPNEFFFSKGYIEYQNYILAIKGNYKYINNLKEIRDKKVVGFQDATKYLGQEFKEYASQNKNYTEYPSQKKQVISLHKKISELIFIDKNIYEYYAKEVGDKLEIEVVYKFPKNVYNIAFNDKELRDKFDKGFDILVKDNKITEIYAKYLSS